MCLIIKFTEKSYKIYFKKYLCMFSKTMIRRKSFWIQRNSKLRDHLQHFSCQCNTLHYKRKKKVQIVAWCFKKTWLACNINRCFCNTATELHFCFTRKTFTRKWASKPPQNLKKMLRASPASNSWVAIFENAEKTLQKWSNFSVFLCELESFYLFEESL